VAVCTDKKAKPIKAFYCAFDICSKTDVRVEVTFPGSTVAYALDATNNHCPIDWTNTFLSSQLRAFQMQPCYMGRIVIQQPNPALLSNLFKAVRHVYF
jgi:hypothetical protein